MNTTTTDAQAEYDAHDRDDCPACRDGKGQSADGSRCRFGRTHTWHIGSYLDGVWVADHAVCSDCGRVEYEGTR